MRSKIHGTEINPTSDMIKFFLNDVKSSIVLCSIGYTYFSLESFIFTVPLSFYPVLH